MNLLDRICTIAGKTIRPPLICAPMAGVTHSAFRRLLADFGGYGALCTEMLSGGSLLAETVTASPFTKKRPVEGAVLYQLRLSGTEDIGRIIEKLSELDPSGIDINLGCPAPEIRKTGGGIELFCDRDRLAAVLESARARWRGPLTVKCRLGKRVPDWREIFIDRLRLFEEHGIDALTVHPRFSDEKLKRTARWDLFPWIAANTRLPLIANGDITAPSTAALALLESGRCCGLMIGRMAVVKPWIFQEFAGERPSIDYLEVWTRFFGYVSEDFPPEKAIGRIKEFTAYYARNFFFGHTLYSGVQGARDLVSLREAAVKFLSAAPRTVREPSVMGI